MITIVAMLLGAVWGGFIARRRKGNRADIAQYAAGFGIAFALAGFILTLLLEKLVF